MSRLGSVAYKHAPWVGVLAALVLWQSVVGLGLVDESRFPSPLTIVDAAATRIPFDDVLGHIWISLFRVVAGFLIALVVGGLLGIAMAWMPFLNKIARGPIEFLRPIPPLAWLAIAILWFGLGEASKLFIIFLGAVFPVFTHTYAGLASVEPLLIRAGQTLGIGGWKLLLKVAAPAALPDIFVGIRVGWGIAFASLVAAEILGAPSGLGFMIMQGRELGDVAMIFYGIILIGILAMATDALIHKAFMSRLRWHFGEDSADVREEGAI